jgi:hypothetical protein
MPEYELDDIREAREARDHAQADLDKAVQIARDKGHSWTQIARSLGVTVQAAWERYRRQVEE